MSTRNRRRVKPDRRSSIAEAARNFLFYEAFSVKDVAIACGFSCPAVFCRAFQAQFGETPRTFRRLLRERQSLAVRPEIRRLTAVPTEPA